MSMPPLTTLDQAVDKNQSENRGGRPSLSFLNFSIRSKQKNQLNNEK